jgi:hypothetical protein
LAKFPIGAKSSIGLGFKVRELLLAHGKLCFEIFLCSAGIRQIRVTPLLGFEGVLLELMLAAAFVLSDIINGFAPQFLVNLVDLNFPAIEAGAPASEFVLRLDFGVGELFLLSLRVFFSGAVESSFFVVDADPIVEIELIFSCTEILNDALESLKQRQHFSYAKIAIHNPF